MYDQILSDIAVAKTKLSGVAGEKGAIKLNIDVVKALEARVKFYMQDWAAAKTISDELIASGEYLLTTTATALKSMWHTDEHQEVIMALKTIQPDETARRNNIYIGLITATGNFAPDFLPSQWVVDMYSDTDHRKSVYFEQKVVEQSKVEYPGIWVVNKYPGNPSLFTGNTNYQHSPILFRIGEMYLISAESALNISGGDALTPLTRIIHQKIGIICVKRYL